MLLLQFWSFLNDTFFLGALLGALEIFLHDQKLLSMTLTSHSQSFQVSQLLAAIITTNVVIVVVIGASVTAGNRNCQTNDQGRVI